jgi:hypothetical protein
MTDGFMVPARAAAGRIRATVAKGMAVFALGPQSPVIRVLEAAGAVRWDTCCRGGPGDTRSAAPHP